jgi:hypothetical protein
LELPVHQLAQQQRQQQQEHLAAHRVALQHLVALQLALPQQQHLQASASDFLKHQGQQGQHQQQLPAQVQQAAVPHLGKQASPLEVPQRVALLPLSRLEQQAAV